MTPDDLDAIRARAAYLRGMQKDALDHAYTVSVTDASVCGQVGHEDVPRLLAAVDAVLGLHPDLPIRLGPDAGKAMCGTCGVYAPCPTVAAITAHLTPADSPTTED